MNRWKGIALAVATVGTMIPAAMGQSAKQSGAEVGLLGIKLYDKFQVLIQRWGSPDQLLPVTVSSTQAGGSGAGAGAGAGAPGGVGAGAPPAGGGGGQKAAAADWSFPVFGNDSENLRQKMGAGGGMQAEPGGDGGPSRGGQGGPPPGFGGPPGGFGPGGPGGGSGVPGGQAQSSGIVQMTRYVYNRDNNKYGFVVDKFGRIVQIEAIGLTNPRVKTRKGITLGSNFAQVVKAYQTPDGYEISGNNVVLRYLSRNKIAFRLSRLGTKQPQKVTGIVIAAAKN